MVFGKTPEGAKTIREAIELLKKIKNQDGLLALYIKDKAEIFYCLGVEEP